MSDTDIFATIGDVACEPVMQAGLAAGENFIYVDIGSIDRETKTIADGKTLAASEAPSRARQVLKAGDVLISMTRPNLNAVAHVPATLDGAIGSTGFHVLRSQWMAPGFLYYLVQTSGFVDAMSGVVQGALYPAVRPADIAKFQFRLPPRAEQTRIVETLEALLSDLDAGVAELKAAQRKLARYRQSLLKAAVDGTLTAGWRADKGKPQEPAADLLQRILRERRARWEDKQRARFAAQGKPPPKDWQAKYPEPVAPDVTGLPALPEGWVWASLDALIEDGPQNGLYLPGNRYGSGTAILRIDDYQIGWHRRLDELNLVNADADALATYSLRTGDLVVNRVNSMTHLGKSLLVPGTLEGVLFESNMMRLRLSGQVHTAFVAHYLGSKVGRSRLTQDAKWAVNQASINQKDVCRTSIPLPPLEEQHAIVDQLDTALAACDAQQAAIAHGLKQAAAQRRNLLKAAFAGQLVPQDPGDEPASALLARIRAAPKQTGRAGARRKA